jgi:hypothetical protein
MILQDLIKCSAGRGVCQIPAEFFCFDNTGPVVKLEAVVLQAM